MMLFLRSCFENGFSDTKIDPTGKYILTSRCRTGRSLRGFRLPPCCSFEERREIERLIVKGLMKLDGDLAGEYFPLAGNYFLLSASQSNIQLSFTDSIKKVHDLMVRNQMV